MSSVPPPHRLTLPNVPINEQGMRQLEIWLEGKFGRRGGGLQYHKARHYGAHNVGDWLFVESISNGGAANRTSHFTAIGQLFKGNESIIFQYDDGAGEDVQIGLHNGAWEGYLDGNQEIIYTQGGNVIRYAGGGDILLYTTDAALAGNGSFGVFTNGSIDDSGGSGDISLDATNSAGGQAGDIALVASGDTTPGTVTLTTFATGSLPDRNPGDVMVGLADGSSFSVASLFSEVKAVEFEENGGGEINIKTAGNTLVVNDHLGSPLVTYTG